MSNVKVRFLIHLVISNLNIFKRVELNIKTRINTKGRFKTVIPGPGDTYKKDIQIMKRSMPNISLINLTIFLLVLP